MVCAAGISASAVAIVLESVLNRKFGFSLIFSSVASYILVPRFVVAWMGVLFVCRDELWFVGYPTAWRVGTLWGLAGGMILVLLCSSIGTDSVYGAAGSSKAWLAVKMFYGVPFLLVWSHVGLAYYSPFGCCVTSMLQGNH